MNSGSKKKILVIRLHATGDVAIILPAVNYIKKNNPDATLQFLTTSEPGKLAGAFEIFSKIHILKEGFGLTPGNYSSVYKKAKRLYSTLNTAFKLKKEKFDLVADLQNNRYSNIVRKITGAASLAEFQNLNSGSHSERILHVFRKSGFESAENDFSLDISSDSIKKSKQFLKDNGWDGASEIIILNPAGLYKTRRWGTDNYIELSKMLIRKGYSVLITGTDKMKNTAGKFEALNSKNVLNVTGKTELSEIPGLLSQIKGIVSDDSGLIHIAWALGIPGLLLLGSTRSDWTCQPGGHIICLNSSDLECGNCMKQECLWGDNRCLARYKPGFIFDKFMSLINR